LIKKEGREVKASGARGELRGMGGVRSLILAHQEKKGKRFRNWSQEKKRQTGRGVGEEFNKEKRGDWSRIHYGRWGTRIESEIVSHQVTKKKGAGGGVMRPF